MSRRARIVGVCVAFAAAAIGISAVPCIVTDTPRNVLADGYAAAPASSAALLYGLDFGDENNIGKNTVSGSAFADATVNKTETNGLTVEKNALKNKNALVFTGGDHENFLSLPVKIFENQNTVTLTGWFSVSDDIVDYGGEIGIHAPDANVAFRSDSKGSYHGNSYLWGVGAVAGIDGDTKVKPVYDTWYHMAYVIDGTNHKFEVYQNGTEVYSSDLVDTFSPSQFNESGGHFYLGQSAYEDNHEDWKGRMSDFRVYGGALDAASIKAEYDIDISDFKTAEYTFDDGTGKDSVRGYDLREYVKAPTYEDGVMKLDGTAAAQIYDSADHNRMFFYGHTAMTVSMRIKIKNSMGDHWKRIMELCSNGGNYVTFMSYCGRGDNNMHIVYRYDFLDYQGSDDSWVLDNMTFAPVNNEWIDLTYVLDGDTISVFENGVLKGQGNTNKPSFRNLFADLINTGNFTIGACTYEDNRNFINAEYDNIRVYAAAAKTPEDIRAARAGYASYALTYAANNGTQESKETFVRKNSDAEIAGCTFEKNGHTFAGWNTAADGSGTSYAQGTVINVTQDTVLYAQWRNVSNYISFDANGGRGEMDVQTIGNGERANINACMFARTGYTFTGWNTEADGSGTGYAQGASIEPVGDMTLYAQWQAKNYKVSFDANGGTGEANAQNLTFGTDAALNANTFKRHGYGFAGWALTATGVAVYTDGQTVTGIGEGNDITLYAVWTVGKFTVTFDANGGSGEMSAQHGTAFEFAEIKINTFTKTGYIFDGWATSATGDKIYDDGVRIALPDDITLYAVWKAEGTEPPVVDPPKSPDKDDSNVGLIVGLTLGGIALATAGVGLALWFVKKKKG